MLDLIREKDLKTPKAIKRRAKLSQRVVESIDSAQAIARAAHKKAYRAWDVTADQKLLNTFNTMLRTYKIDYSIMNQPTKWKFLRDIAEVEQRSTCAIQIRLRHLKMLNRNAPTAQQLKALSASVKP